MTSPQLLNYPRLRALLVDDQQEHLDLFTYFLEKSGQFAVDTANDLDSAAEKLRIGVYDVVLVDRFWGNEEKGRTVIELAEAQSYNPATAFLTGYPTPDPQVVMLNKACEKEKLIADILDLVAKKREEVPGSLLTLTGEAESPTVPWLRLTAFYTVFFLVAIGLTAIGAWQLAFTIYQKSTVLSFWPAAILAASGIALLAEFSAGLAADVATYRYKVRMS